MVQPAETAPAATQTPPTPGNEGHPISGPISSLFVADQRPDSQPDAGRGGLPMDLDKIDAFMTGSASLDVPATAIEPATPPLEAAPATPPAAPAPAAPVPPVTPPAVPPVTPVAPVETTPPVVPVEPVAPIPAVASAPSAPVIPEDVQRALSLQTSLNGSKQPGEPGYVSLTDAIGKIAEADKPAPAAPVVDHVAVAGERVTSIDGELKALLEKRRELAEGSSFYGPAHQELDDQILAKSRELTKAELEQDKAKDTQQAATKAAEARATQASVTARKAAMDTAAANFPSVANKATPLGSKVDKLVKEMQNPNHPDHAVLFSDNAAIHVTEKAAMQLAQEIAAASNGATTFAQAFDSLRAPAAAPAAVPPVAPVESEPRRVSPVAGATGTPPPAAPATEAQIMAASLDNPDLIDAALYGGRSPTHYIH